MSGLICISLGRDQQELILGKLPLAIFSLIEEELIFRRTIQYKLYQWGIDAGANGRSCGNVLEVGKGNGAGDYL